MANLGLCNKCKKIVPVKHREEKGKEYLDKYCPECGLSTSSLSDNSYLYRKKKLFGLDKDYNGCQMNCLECNHRNPSMILVETTNRCNMNCAICITNVPSMGFQFEPKLEFFDKIFKHYAQFKQKPALQLFGGEPTLREDLFDIIKLAKSYGFSVRLVTNGLKLADKDYADKIIESGVTVLISFDGLNKEMYRRFRKSEETLDLKLKALENLNKHKREKVVLMTVIDKEINGKDMPEFLKYCLGNEQIRGLFIMPLTPVWSKERLDYFPERTSVEDIEQIVSNAVAGGVEFVPFGVLDFKAMAEILNLKLLPLTVVHPNCEMVALLFSDGKSLASPAKYLKGEIFDFVKDLIFVENKLSKKNNLKDNLGIKIYLYFKLLQITLKHVNLNAIIGKKGFRAFEKWMIILGKLISGKSVKNIIREDTLLKRILCLVILPFEDDDILESQRLERCANTFAYVDVCDDKVKSIPFCIWEKYKAKTMKDIARKYNKDGYTIGLLEQDKDEDSQNLLKIGD